MQNMKKFVGLSLAALMAVSMTACGSGSGNSSSGSKAESGLSLIHICGGRAWAAVQLAERGAGSLPPTEQRSHEDPLYRRR